MCKTHLQSVTRLFLLALGKQDLPLVAVHRWLLQMLSVEANFTANSQDSHNNVQYCCGLRHVSFNTEVKDV